MVSISRVLQIVLTAVAILPSAALAQDYRYRIVDAQAPQLPPTVGNMGTTGVGISSSGNVLLQFQSLSDFGAYVRDPARGTVRRLSLPAGSSASGISKSRVVGTTENGRGFIVELSGSLDAVSFFDYPGAAKTSLVAVNDNGDVLGEFEEPPTPPFSRGPKHAFLMDKTGALILRSFDPPGALSGMNNKRDIVGTMDGSPMRGFVLRFGGVAEPPFSCQGADTSLAAINDHGDVVGTFVDGSFVFHPFVAWAGEECVALDTELPNAFAANGINNLRQVVGTFQSIESAPDVHGGALGVFHAFVRARMDYAIDHVSQCGSSWGTVSYALHNEANPGTICRYGCGLTSLTMAASYVSVSSVKGPSDITGPSIRCERTSIDVGVNPGTMNCLLQLENGYTFDSDVDWDTATKAIGKASTKALIFRSNRVASLTVSSTGVSRNEDAENVLRAALRDFAVPMIVGVKLQLTNVNGELALYPRHFVLVNGVTPMDTGAFTYSVIDPQPRSKTDLRPRATSLDDFKYYIDCTAGPKGVCDEEYLGTEVSQPFPVFSTRGSVIDPVDLSSLTVVVGNNAKVAVTAPDGAVTGSKGIDNTETTEIPLSAYFVDGAEDSETGRARPGVSRSVVIESPAQGTYKVQVTGLVAGPLSVAVRRFTRDGVALPEIRFGGLATPGVSSTFEFEYQSEINTDNIPPTTTSTISPPLSQLGWSRSSVIVNLVATDNAGGSGVKEINYSLVGAEIGGGSVSSNTLSIPVNTDGTTTLAFSARDNAGNAEPQNTVTVRIDKTKPTATAGFAPVGKVKKDKARFRVQLACKDNLQQEIQAVGKLNGIPVTNGQLVELELDKDRKTRFRNGVLELEARSFSLVATCTDLAGNMSTATAVPNFEDRKHHDDDDDDDRHRKHRGDGKR